MKYKIAKLRFNGNVHFGEGTLEKSGFTLSSDTIFSAICCELAKIGKEEEIEQLISCISDGKLKISDAFPFNGKQLFLPRPFINVKADNDEGDSVKKKAFKKLKFIPIDKYDMFLKGNFKYQECKKALNDITDISKFAIYEQVAIEEGADSEPYSVGKVRFRDDCGLWFIIAADDDDIMKKLFELIRSLGISGIGGKRSSGCGRFVVKFVELPEYLLSNLERESEKAVSLSVCLPRNEEIENALEDASYGVLKRSGFVYSENYASSSQKKNDLYVFVAGSCFKNRFKGDVYDVSAGGSHKVYRYAVPMFLSIGGE